MLNAYESDLFFNQDDGQHDCAIIGKKGKFIGYDDDALTIKARDFCVYVEFISCGQRVITPKEVLADFYKRL